MPKQEDLPPSPFLKANIISKLFFWWLHPIFTKGNKRPLEHTDLYQTLPKDKSKPLGDEIQNLWEQELKRNKPSLTRVIIKQFGVYYMLVGLLAFFEECFTKIVQPICLGFLIKYFTTKKTTNWEGYLLATGVVLGSACYTFTHHPYFFGVQYVGMRIRIACCSLIYRKSLRLSQAALGTTTIGQMVNLLSNDVNRFDQSTIFLHYLWIGPVQTMIVTVILWTYIGFKETCLAGLAVLVIFIPFQGYMGKLFSKLRASTAGKTDVRIRIMNEIVSAMKIIKCYAWEGAFSTLVGVARKEEIHVIKKTNTLRALNMSLFYTSSKVIIFLTLLTFILAGDGKLTAHNVFVTLALYNNVRLIMTLFFPSAVSALAESLVSVKRIENFLLMEERKDSSIQTNDSSKNGTLKFEEFYAKWAEQETLSDINLSLEKGELLAIVGQVGSGKTSLLQAILKELPPSSGKVKVYGKLAYFSQETWIFGGSVRQNILFGRVFNEARYGEVLEACCLGKDLELLPHGDHTLVGQSTLSGGQRARITLARAVYEEDVDVYLLDDPLSAVDTSVSRHLFNNCILGILKQKTVILVTHQVQLLQNVPKIILLHEGRIKATGNYNEITSIEAKEQIILKSPSLATRIMRTRTISNTSVKKRGSSSIGLGIGNESSWGSAFSINVDDFNEDFVVDEDEDEEGEEVALACGDKTLFKNTGSVQKLSEENSATGRVSLGLYLEYFRQGSSCFMGIVLVISNIITQILYTGADWWLNYWTKTESDRNRNEPPKSSTSYAFYQDKNLHIYVYSGIIVALFIASLIRTLVFFNVCMTASTHLHESMFNGLIRSPLRYFELNPVGRILNRITKDIGCIDELLPPTMFDTMEIFLNVIGILVIVSMVNPIVLAPASILILIFYFLRKFYLRTARSVKRLEGVARSPVFSHLSTSLYGLTTIRAFKTETDFIKQFDDYQDMHTATWYIFIAITRWFGIWLDWISVTFIAFVTYSFLVMDFASGADVGLAVSSAMMLTGMFQWGVRQSAEVENQMVSVERVMEYTKLIPEAALENETPPPKEWPSKGEIQFENVILRYGTDEPILKGISFHVKDTEKIGICGRTGAGKSSLLTALFRIAESSGSIKIDGININSIGLHDLRSKLSYIPQEPVLFSATMRYNLDPFRSYDDSSLWSALEDVQLSHDVRQFSSGLDLEITENGANFSVGQRQLVCLARAILKKNKLLFLDEATANCDIETDKLIQKTIRTKFENCTVLTVAHRLNTVMDMDRIMVLDGGVIMEFDEPYVLLQNPDSALYALAAQSEGLEDLIEIAKNAELMRRNK